MRAQPYDTSPEVINTTFQRSIYYTADAYPLPLKIDEFLNEAKRDVPVILHAHGCSGVSWDEQRLGTFYAEQKVNMVMLDFIKVEGRKLSCEPFPKAGGWPEVSNPDRIAARRLEMESQIQWFRAKVATDNDEASGTRAAQALLGHTTEAMTADYIRQKVGRKVKPSR